MQALRLGWLPTVLSAGTTALGIGSLMVSKLTPIRHFGVFGSAGVAITSGLLLSLVPMALFLWPPRSRLSAARISIQAALRARSWDRAANVIQQHRWAFLVAAFSLMLGLGYGIRYLSTSVRIETLFSDNSRILRDYRSFRSKWCWSMPRERPSR